ncbi:MAG TPA: substrate-binding domain-containing protein [Xanthobacteraceae bacterium]|nr:substrate-binding domain-containing protein [Xanthobacteraceae bacterium]
MSAAAMREIVVELGEKYAPTGIKLVPEFTRSPLVRDRIGDREPFDIAVTTQARIGELAKANKVIAETVIALARSHIGVAVKSGQPKPDIGSVAAFKRALQTARSIACADPAFGTASGLYLADLFARLGLAAELKSENASRWRRRRRGSCRVRSCRQRRSRTWPATDCRDCRRARGRSRWPTAF